MPHLALKSLALPLALGFTCAHADEAPLFTLAPVVVTATRFVEPLPAIPANLSVITREQIEALPALSLPDILRSRAGVDVRSTSGALNTEASIDLRGFGEAASGNTLILLDGQRLNSIDSSNINWATIPQAGIERIEILRGSGSVLYGDRAVGGVINLVTDRTHTPRATLKAGIGPWGYREVDAHFSGTTEPLFFRLAAHYASSEGWRRNSQSDQLAASGRVGTRFSGGGVHVDFSVYQDSAELPGALFTAQYRDDPTHSRTPFDWQNRKGYTLRPGIEARLADDLQFEAELGFLREDMHSSTTFPPAYVWTSVIDRDKSQVSFTPRLKWRHGLGGLASETVFGFDYLRGSAHSLSNDPNSVWATQVSAGHYLQNLTRFGDALTLTLGYRGQHVTQSSLDSGNASYGEHSFNQHAWDAGLNWAINPQWRMFGRAHRSFRFANTDELWSWRWNGSFWQLQFRNDLKPQVATGEDFGFEWRTATLQLRGTAYRQRLVNEIGFDPLNFDNVNFDPTRRSGTELELDWAWSKRGKLHFALAQNQAVFRSGPYAGKQIPLAARVRASIGIDWNGGKFGRHGLSIHHLARRHGAGDLDNAFAQQGGYTTADWQSVFDFKPWQLNLKVMNLGNQRYATVVGHSFSYNEDYFYPAEPRSVYVSARYDFR